MEPEQKPKLRSRNLWAIVLVLISLFVVLPMITAVMGFLSPFFLTGIFSQSGEWMKGDDAKRQTVARVTTTYKPETPDPIADLAVSKTISVKDGGNIKLTDPNGVETDLFFFPDSLEKDTKITVTPLKKFPLADYGATLTPGVLIEPKTARFRSPAILTFTFPKNNKQSKLDLDSVTKTLLGINQADAAPMKGPITSDDGAYANIDIFELAPLPGPASNSGGGGIVSSNDAEGTSGAVPATTSSDSSSVTGPINGGGSYAPDNIDGTEAGNMADAQMNANGGKCDSDTANMINYAMVMDERSGNISGYTSNRTALSDCADDVFESVLEKCKNNRIEVRRKDFYLLMSLFRTTGDNEKIEATRDLMNACTGRYSATGSHSLGSGVGGVATTQVSAETCGFIDDPWKGSYYLGIAIETISNDITFSLPYKGGAVFQKHAGSAAGAANMNIAAAGIT